MYSLTTSILLIPYAIVLFFVALFSVINLYHLVHFGATTRNSFGVVFLYLAGIFVILATTWTLLIGTNWSEPIPVSLPSFSTPTDSSFPTLP